MIKRIKISNFQSHRETQIDFDPGVNALVGLSDNGKTVVLRALEWVRNNRPLGDGFRSYWGGDTVVAVTLGCGTVIIRGRTTSKNWYSVVPVDGPAQDFVAFGQDPPAEVTALFNMNEINTSAQMDAPFLLSESEGQVAQILNRAVNLDCIDSAISGIRKKKRTADDNLKSNEAQVQKLNAQVEALDWLDTADAALKEAEVVQQRADDALIKRTGLGYLRDKIQRLTDDTRPYLALIAAEPMLTGVEGLQRRLQEVRDDAEIIGGHLFKAKRLTAVRKASRDLVAAAPGIVLAESAVTSAATTTRQADRLDSLLEKIEVACKQTKGFKQCALMEAALVEAEQTNQLRMTMTKNASGLGVLLSRIESSYANSAKHRTDLVVLEAEYQREMPDVCPLCGRS